MSGRASDKCRDLGPLLGRVTDGEATPEEALRVARHLPDCTTCRIVLAREHRLATMLERGMEDALHEDEAFVVEVMERLPSGPPARPRRRKGRRALRLASLGGVLTALASPLLNLTTPGAAGTLAWSLAPRIAPPDSGGFTEGAAQFGGLMLMAMNRVSRDVAFDSSGALVGLLGPLALTAAVAFGLAASAGAMWLWIKPSSS